MRRESKAKALSVWQQMFLCFLLFIILPVGIVFLVYSYTYINSITRNIILHSESELEVLDDNISNYLHQFKALSDSMLLNRSFMGIVAKWEEGNYEYEAQYITNMKIVLRDVYNLGSNVDTLMIVDMDNNVISVGHPYFGDIHQIVEDYRSSMDAGDGILIWGTLGNGTNRQAIICRKINGVNSKYEIKGYGYMIMLVEEDTLFDYYKSLKSMLHSQFFLLDKDSVIISSNMREKVGSAFKWVENSDYFLVGRKLRINEWTIAYRIPRDSINENVRQTLLFVAVATALCITLASIASLFLSKRLNSPLILLSENMGKVVLGNYDIELKTNQTNEVGELYRSFNTMVSELNKLINTNIALELQTKEALIQSYQRQVDPHFIYNTLDMIRMMALLKENGKIEEAVICLSEILRFNLKAEKEVLIEQEFKNIEHYFRILKLRHGDNFDYEIQVQEDIKQNLTLKFLIQPFIENSMKHGLEKVRRKGFIRIVAKKINNEIVFVIQDNGIGFTKDKLIEVHKIINGDITEQNLCIGMKNVQKRIQLSYGDNYGVEIISKYDKRTSVILNIPSYGEMESNV